MFNGCSIDVQSISMCFSTVNGPLRQFGMLFKAHKPAASRQALQNMTISISHLYKHPCAACVLSYGQCSHAIMARILKCASFPKLWSFYLQPPLSCSFKKTNYAKACYLFSGRPQESALEHVSAGSFSLFSTDYLCPCYLDNGKNARPTGDHLRSNGNFPRPAYLGSKSYKQK